MISNVRTTAKVRIVSYGRRLGHVEKRLALLNLHVGLGKYVSTLMKLVTQFYNLAWMIRGLNLTPEHIGMQIHVDQSASECGPSASVHPKFGG